MRSVRLRLLILALLPLVVFLPILLAITMARWSHEFNELLISKVAGDLRIAEQYMQRIVVTQGNQITALAASTRFRDALTNGDQRVFLETSREELGLDYLVLRDWEKGQTLSPESVVVEQAIASGSATSIDLFSAQDLAAAGAGLAARANIPLVDTQAAIPTKRTAEDRGMVVLGATRVLNEGKTSILIGGTLLNRNLGFIDTINDLVYRTIEGEEGRTGTATLFLEDVRISTNVRLFENVRALGTRVSEVVYRTVVEEGRTWLDRAFVVNDWYISGYLPITNSKAQRIGMLYVGFLEEPYVTLIQRTYAALISAFIIVVALSVPFFLWLARGVFSPMEQMNRTMERVEAGDLDARIGDITSKDEIGLLARHLNALLDQVQERDRELRDWAGELNIRVEDRTSELREANDKLETTFKQLVVSEKLASIGEITAGVAHEINNPIAVIQGNMDVIRLGLGGHANEVQTELNLVDEQVRRINLIVGKLLQFANPSEYADYSESVDVVRTLEDSLVLVQHAMALADVQIERTFSEAPLVYMHRGELQQVLINLMMNAIQAMPDGGVLTLGAEAVTREGVLGTQARIVDNGGGMSSKTIDQVFDPFFTTKRGEGTGLGLSISQSLIQRAGGQISVKSKIGRGSEFLVWLPKVNKLSDKN